MKASEEAETIKKDAWQEGYQLGREEAQEIVNDARKARRDEMERFTEQLRQTRDEILSGMEEEIIDFCLSVAEKVVNAAIDRTRPISARSSKTRSRRCGARAGSASR